MKTRALVLAGAGLIVAGGLVGCGGRSGGTSAAKANTVAVTSTDTDCKVDTATLAAGKHTFTVANDGSRITEFYLYAEGDRVVGEVENIAPGLHRDLVVELPAGSYQAACKPGMVGTGIRSTLTVSGSAAALSDDAKLASAVANYTAYVQSQVDSLVDQTGAFVTAVKAGDVDKAKALFPVARTYYERIEPVAESFGDLDPKIDARENDVDPGTGWTGFHRIEKDLWGAGIAADGPLADQLNTDVGKLRGLVATVKLTPLELANGAKELLDEVASSKVTGEEDRYSHTDLWDFAANVEGSQAAVAALRPALDDKDSALGRTLDTRFAAVQDALAKLRTGDRYTPYTALSPDQIKNLSDLINGLAEPISKVAATVAGTK
jgi:iron uptake system component EfeO